MKKYDELLLKKVQRVDLQMAKFFVEYCKKNDLLCYFCGGGCIGTVRHKGFIPWDDDLDFFMPRESYEKLKVIWKDTEEYGLVFPTELYNDHNMFATLRDKNTTMIKPYQADIDMIHGISIDIFPLDACPQGIHRKVQIFWGLVYQLFCSQIVPENHGVIITIIGKSLLSIFKNPKLRYAIWRKAEKEMSKYEIKECKYVTEICAGPKYMKNEYPKELFSGAIYKKFEDTEMPIPIGFDKYLKMAFGNYMEFPPLEKRVPEHDAVKIDTDRSYRDYKGIFYCTEKNEK